MSKFRKFYLVDPVKYDQLVEKTHPSNDNRDVLAHPNVKAVKSIGKQMTDALEDDKLTDVEKIAAYTSHLDSYIRNFRNALQVPRQNAILGDNKPTPQAPTQKTTHIQDSLPNANTFIPKGISKSYLTNANHLNTFISQNKNFSVNNKGDLQYKGDDMFQLPYGNLLKGVVRYKKPEGDNSSMERFLKVLKDENYPISRLAYVKRTSALKAPATKTNLTQIPDDLQQKTTRQMKTFRTTPYPKKNPYRKANDLVKARQILSTWK